MLNISNALLNAKLLLTKAVYCFGQFPWGKTLVCLLYMARLSLRREGRGRGARVQAETGAEREISTKYLRCNK